MKANSPTIHGTDTIKKSNFYNKIVLTAVTISMSASNITMYKNIPNNDHIFNINYCNNDSLRNDVFVDVLQQKNLNKIELMGSFQDDWNGNGGMAFSKSALSMFKEIIKNLSTQPEIAPTGRNSLYMEFKKTDESVLAFEISETAAEKIIVPCGHFEDAIAEKFTDEVVRNVKNSVVEFYG